MSMWEPFTEQARRAIVRAQEVAQRHGDAFISHHHILIAVADDDDIAAILSALGADRERVRKAAEKTLGEESFRPMQEMTFTGEAKRMIELGFEAARNLDTRYIASEHLALGYLQLGSQHTQFVSTLEIDAEKFREMLVESLEKKPKPNVGQDAPKTFGAASKGLLEKSFTWMAQRKVAELRPDALWDALSGAAAEKNLAAALAYGFLIARLNGWDADETAQHILEAAKRRFDN